MAQMSKIEDLVIFKNEKELSETEKSIEKIFGISFQSYVRRLEIGLDAEGLSHDDDSAVAHILADMGKKDSILWIFSLCCEDSREAAKILYANTIGCVLASLNYLSAQQVKSVDLQKKLFAWTEDEEGSFSIYQNRLKALRKKKREIEKMRPLSGQNGLDFFAELICPYEFIPPISTNKSCKDFLTPLFEKAVESIVKEERHAVSWNILRLAAKEKDVLVDEAITKNQRKQVRTICKDLYKAIEKIGKIDFTQCDYSEMITLAFAREILYHCKLLKLLLENEDNNKKLHISENELRILREASLPVAFYLDKIKIEEIYDITIKNKYCRYIKMVTVALVEYAGAKLLRERKKKATQQEKIQEAYGILKKYTEFVWEDYFAFLDEKPQENKKNEEGKESNKKINVSNEIVKVVYACFLNRNAIYNAPLDYDVIPQMSMVDELPLMKNQDVYIVKDGKLKGIKQVVTKPCFQSELQVDIRRIVSHNGLKMGQEVYQKKQKKFLKEMDAHKLLKIKEDEIVFDIFKDGETWDEFLLLFGKTAKDFCARDFEFEVIPTKGEIEILSGSKNPKTMQSFLKGNGISVNENSKEKAETEITYGGIVGLLNALVARRDPFWEGTICMQVDLGKLKGYRGSDSYLLRFDAKCSLTKDGRVLWHDVENL